MKKEEGHYTIKIVEKLPKRGNSNWLYSLKDDNLSVYYYWTLNNTYKKISISDSLSTSVQAGDNIVITGTGTEADPYIINAVQSNDNHIDITTTSFSIPADTKDRTVYRVVNVNGTATVDLNLIDNSTVAQGDVLTTHIVSINTGSNIPNTTEETIISGANILVPPGKLPKFNFADNGTSGIVTIKSVNLRGTINHFLSGDLQLSNPITIEPTIYLQQDQNVSSGNERILVTTSSSFVEVINDTRIYDTGIYEINVSFNYSINSTTEDFIVRAGFNSSSLTEIANEILRDRFQDNSGLFNTNGGSVTGTAQKKSFSKTYLWNSPGIARNFVLDFSGGGTVEKSMWGALVIIKKISNNN